MSRTQEATSYWRGFVQLASAELVSAAIVIGSAPIISRLYSVSDFGNYELYFASATFISALSMMGYERTVLLENTDQDQFDAMSVSAACLLAIVGLSFGVLCLIGMSGEYTFVKNVWTWALPLFVLFSGIFSLNSIYLTRIGGFRALGKLKVASSIFAVSSQIAFASYQLGTLGLVISNLISQLLVAACLSFICWRKLLQSHYRPSSERMLSLAKRHWRIPVFALPGNMLAIATSSLPAVFLAKVDVNLLGSYAFTRRILGLPLGTLSASLSRLYANALANEIAANRTPFNVVVRNLTQFMLGGVVLFAGLTIVGTPTIPVVFGEQWRPAIPYILLFGFEMCNRFAFGSTSAIMYYGKLPKYDVIWQIMNASAIAVSFVVAAFLGLSIFWTVFAYVATSAVCYWSYGTIALLASRRLSILT